MLQGGKQPFDDHHVFFLSMAAIGEILELDPAKKQQDDHGTLSMLIANLAAFQAIVQGKMVVLSIQILDENTPEFRYTETKGEQKINQMTRRVNAAQLAALKCMIEVKVRP